MMGVRIAQSLEQQGINMQRYIGFILSVIALAQITEAYLLYVWMDHRFAQQTEQALLSTRAETLRMSGDR